jgi:hypothetical protein
MPVSMDNQFTVFQTTVVHAFSQLCSPRRMKTLNIQEPMSFEMLGITHPTIHHDPADLNLRIIKLLTLMHSTQDMNDMHS